MKTKVITGIVLTLFLATMLTMPIAAQEEELVYWQPKRAMFFGYGRGVCDDVETPENTWGDRFYFSVLGWKKCGTWTGRGFWVDVDWHEGVLKAVLRVTGGRLAHDPNPGHITEIFQLHGQAKVFIDGVYKGTYGFELHLADADASVNPPGAPGEQPDWIGLHLFVEETRWYATGNPRVKRGDIVTRWYPEFSE